WNPYVPFDFSVIMGTPNFTISASPSSLSIAQGNQGTSTITTAVSGGFNSSITLSKSALPAGVNVSFSPHPLPSPCHGGSIMTLMVHDTPSPALYPNTTPCRAWNTYVPFTFTVTISAPNFTISASPSSLSIAQGHQGTSTITTAISGGYNSAINLRASG